LYCVKVYEHTGEFKKYKYIKRIADDQTTNRRRMIREERRERERWEGD
jgi:hypothetical protein